MNYEVLSSSKKSYEDQGHSFLYCYGDHYSYRTPIQTMNHYIHSVDSKCKEGQGHTLVCCYGDQYLYWAPFMNYKSVSSGKKGTIIITPYMLMTTLHVIMTISSQAIV